MCILSCTLITPGSANYLLQVYQVRCSTLECVLLSPAYILTISSRFTVAPPVFTQRLRSRLLIRRIVFRRRCVNTHGATVNRGEIVSMYAGLNMHPTTALKCANDFPQVKCVTPLCVLSYTTNVPPFRTDLTLSHKYHK